MSDATVTKNSAENRFEVVTDTGVAFLTYRENPNHITLIHTEVPAARGGQGLGGALAHAAFEYAREAGLRVIPHCHFVQAYLTRHPEYKDLTETAK
jgi:predicted GNAT family acetyltransferase